MRIKNRLLFVVLLLIMPFCSVCQNSSVCQDSILYKIISIVSIEGGDYIEIDRVRKKEKDTITRSELTVFCNNNDGKTRILARDFNGNNRSVWYPPTKQAPPSGPNTESGRTIKKGGTTPTSIERLGYCEHMYVTTKYPEKRLALLIGNNDYDPSQYHLLMNPDNDIDAVTGRLNELGFDIYSLYNAKMVEMEAALDMFYDSAEKYDVVLFYYAGHGTRTNDKDDYIVPVDAKKENFDLLNPPKLYDYKKDYIEQLSIGNIVKKCHDLTKANKKVILVIDACRNYPGVKNDEVVFDYNLTPTSDGICLVQSTMPSETATDTVLRGKCTPFATAFINTIGSTGNDIDYEFNEIRKKVAEDIRQRPTINNNILNEQFFFCKNCISTEMKLKYDETFKEAKKEFEDDHWGIARANFEILPLSFDSNICTYLAVCNYKMGDTTKADSLFKIAENAYNTKFFTEEYGKRLRDKELYKEALYKLLKYADTTKAKHEDGLFSLKLKYSHDNNWIKDSIGILYENLAKQDSNKSYLDSAFLWYERSNSPYSRYRRLDLLKKKEISDSWGRRSYETRLYYQMKRLMKKYYVVEAMFYLGKYNTENEIFTKASRMHKIGVKGLKKAGDLTHKQARELLDQINSEYNSSHYQHENDTLSVWSKWLSVWSKWRNYTKEEWKFTDYWGGSVQYNPGGYKDFIIAGHYRHKCFSIGFGYGKSKLEKDIFSEQDDRMNYIFDLYKDVDVERDAYNYNDTPYEKDPWMFFVEPGFNFSNIVTLSLGVGCVSISRGFEYKYNVGHDITYKNSIKSNGPYFLLYPQLHLHLLLTEWIHSGFGFGITIDMGYRQIYGKDCEAILNINKIIEQNNGFTCGVGLEFAF